MDSGVCRYKDVKVNIYELSGAHVSPYLSIIVSGERVICKTAAVISMRLASHSSHGSEVCTRFN